MQLCKMVSDGTADAVIVFPHNFTKDAYTAIKNSTTSVKYPIPECDNMQG